MTLAVEPCGGLEKCTFPEADSSDEVQYRGGRAREGKEEGEKEEEREESRVLVGVCRSSVGVRGCIKNNNMMTTTQAERDGQTIGLRRCWACKSLLDFLAISLSRSIGFSFRLFLVSFVPPACRASPQTKRRPWNARLVWHRFWSPLVRGYDGQAPLCLFAERPAVLEQIYEFYTAVFLFSFILFKSLLRFELPLEQSTSFSTCGQ